MHPWQMTPEERLENLEVLCRQYKKDYLRLKKTAETYAKRAAQMLKRFEEYERRRDELKEDINKKKSSVAGSSS